MKIPRDRGVLSNDTDPDTDHDGLKALLVCPPAHCSEFSLNADGGFTYRNDGKAAGNDAFTYRPFDGEKYGDPVIVAVRITNAVI